MTVAGNNTYEVLRLAQKEIIGMNLAYASTTTATISAGITRDSEDLNQITFSASKTLNFAVNGLNGLDTGAIGASKLYYVFAIGDSLGANPAGVIASLSATPLLPRGSVVDRPYDQYRRIGWLRSGAGSTLLNFKQNGNRNVRQYFYDTMIQVLSNGTSQTLAAIDLSVACPPIDNLSWYSHTEFTPATAGDSVKFAPFGSTATVIPGLSGVVASQKQQAQLKLLAALDSGVPKTLYINSAAVCDTDMWCWGFEDVLN